MGPKEIFADLKEQVSTPPEQSCILPNMILRMIIQPPVCYWVHGYDIILELPLGYLVHGYPITSSYGTL